MITRVDGFRSSNTTAPWSTVLTSLEHDSESELAWVRLTEYGAHAVTAGQLAAAGQSWQEAYTLARHFSNGDPRFAASFNNLGVLAQVEANREEARRLYREALLAWDRAYHWVEGMSVAQRAASSTFHLRMEQRHRHHYNRIALSEQHKQLSQARAVTEHNSANARSADQGRAPPPADLRMPTPNEPFFLQAGRENWIIDRPPEFTDEGRLMAARLCLCCLGSASGNA